VINPSYKTQKFSPALLRILAAAPLLFLVAACSQHSNGVVSKAYHNTTAHYNAYFLAKQKLEEVEHNLFVNRKDDYNQLLDVVAPVDTNIANTIRKETDYSIEKASLAIQRHKNSKWLDDSYLLVGKARIYQADFPNAIETFKFVNSESKDKDAHHLALTGLLRAFTEQKDYNYARAVIERAKKEKLSKQTLAEFYLVRGQFHKQQQEYDQMLAVLKQASKLMHKGEKRARVNFIIAQLYLMLEKPALAYKYFRATFKNNPSYDLAFYAQLNMIQTFPVQKGDGKKKLMAYFKKLLNDSKNADYKDKIYYQMALFEYRHSNYPESVKYLKQSVANNTNDANQKAYSFLKLGEIHYEKLQQYNLAKAYYDSTMQSLPPTTPNFDAIAKRHKVLDSFVKHINTIQTEDSLQRLAKMDSQSLNKYLEDQIALEEKRQEELAEKQSQDIQQEASSIFAADNGKGQNKVGGGDDSQGKWYFYNTASLSRGKTSFSRKWGNRKLEDNWRRSTKEANVDFSNPNSPPVATTEPAKPKLSKEEEIKQKKEGMLATLPLSKEAMEQSNQKLEDAYYNLGKIYNLELNEQKNAIKTYEDLLTRFPDSEHKPEIYYLLYLVYKDQADEKQDIYKNKLLSEFPNSAFTKLIENPNYIKDGNMAGVQAQKAFAEAYSQFEAQNFEEANRLVDEALQMYANSTDVERFKVLKIKIIGKSGDVNAYRNALNEFIQQYPQSKLLPYVQNLLKGTEGFAKSSK
jgi:tetratricopeptide (TPR) repeat protein